MKPLYPTGQKQVICFDMNQTLLDPVQSFHDSFLAVLRQYTARWDGGASQSPEQVLAVYQNEWNRRSRQLSGSNVSRDSIRRQCLTVALKPLPLPGGDKFAERFLREVKEGTSSTPHLYPGVRETLDQLSGRYRLAIISNGRREHHERHLLQLGLNRLVTPEELFTSARKETRKPNPHLFQLALRTMKATPEQAVMVGNSWTNDVTGAVRAGMDAIWLRTDHKERLSFRQLGPVKVAVIRKFEQLQQLL